MLVCVEVWGLLVVQHSAHERMVEVTVVGSPHQWHVVRDRFTARIAACMPRHTYMPAQVVTCLPCTKRGF